MAQRLFLFLIIASLWATGAHSQDVEKESLSEGLRYRFEVFAGPAVFAQIEGGRSPLKERTNMTSGVLGAGLSFSPLTNWQVQTGLRATVVPFRLAVRPQFQMSSGDLVRQRTPVVYADYQNVAIGNYIQVGFTRPLNPSLSLKAGVGVSVDFFPNAKRNRFDRWSYEQTLENGEKLEHLHLRTAYNYGTTAFSLQPGIGCLYSLNNGHTFTVDWTLNIAESVIRAGVLEERSGDADREVYLSQTLSYAAMRFRYAFGTRKIKKISMPFFGS